MAFQRFKSIASSSDDYATGVECGVCLGKFYSWDSGALKCGHTFCHLCLMKFIRISSSREDEVCLCCPLCRKPMAGVEETGVYGAMLRIREHIKCLDCGEKAVPKSEASFCNDCCVSLCRSCKENLHLGPNHTVVPFSSEQALKLCMEHWTEVMAKLDDWHAETGKRLDHVVEFVKTKAKDTILNEFSEIIDENVQRASDDYREDYEKLAKSTKAKLMMRVAHLNSMFGEELAAYEDTGMREPDTMMRLGKWPEPRYGKYFNAESRDLQVERSLFRNVLPFSYNETFKDNQDMNLSPNEFKMPPILSDVPLAEVNAQISQHFANELCRYVNKELFSSILTEDPLFRDIRANADAAKVVASVSARLKSCDADGRRNEGSVNGPEPTELLTSDSSCTKAETSNAQLASTSVEPVFAASDIGGDQQQSSSDIVDPDMEGITGSTEPPDVDSANTSKRPLTEFSQVNVHSDGDNISTGIPSGQLEVESNTEGHQSNAGGEISVESGVSEWMSLDERDIAADSSRSEEINPPGGSNSETSLALPPVLQAREVVIPSDDSFATRSGIPGNVVFEAPAENQPVSDSFEVINTDFGFNQPGSTSAAPINQTDSVVSIGNHPSVDPDSGGLSAKKRRIESEESTAITDVFDVKQPSVRKLELPILSLIYLSEQKKVLVSLPRQQFFLCDVGSDNLGQSVQMPTFLWSSEFETFHCLAVTNGHLFALAGFDCLIIINLDSWTPEKCVRIPDDKEILKLVATSDDIYFQTEKELLRVSLEDLMACGGSVEKTAAGGKEQSLPLLSASVFRRVCVPDKHRLGGECRFRDMCLLQELGLIAITQCGFPTDLGISSDSDSFDDEYYDVLQRKKVPKRSPKTSNHKVFFIDSATNQVKDKKVIPSTNLEHCPNDLLDICAIPSGKIIFIFSFCGTTELSAFTYPQMQPCGSIPLVFSRTFCLEVCGNCIYYLSIDLDDRDYYYSRHADFVRFALPEAAPTTSEPENLEEKNQDDGGTGNACMEVTVEYNPDNKPSISSAHHDRLWE